MQGLLETQSYQKPKTFFPSHPSSYPCPQNYFDPCLMQDTQFMTFLNQELLNQHSETKVLLVCVYNKNGNLITHDILFKLFANYGKVNKILIFEKTKIWKIFVEMETVQQAKLAKEQLNNFILFNDDSRIHIFFSNKNSIDFQNNNSGGIDYNVLKYQLQNQRNFNICAPIQQQYDATKDSMIKNKQQLMKTDLQNNLEFLDQIVQQFDEKFEGNINGSSFQQMLINETFEEKNNKENSQIHHSLNSNSDLLTNDSQEDCLFDQITNNALFDSNSHFQQQQQQQQHQESVNGSSQKLETLLLNTQNFNNNEFANSDIFSSSIKSGQKLLSSPSLISNLNSPSDFQPTYQQKQQQQLHLNSKQLQKQGQPSKGSSLHRNSQQIQQQQTQQSQQQSSAASSLSQSLPQQQLSVFSNFNFNNNASSCNSSSNQANHSQSQIQLQQSQLQQVQSQDNINNDLSNYINPDFLKENQKSNVIYVRGIDSQVATGQMVFNLFGTFGNIIKIAFIPDKNAVLIEYQNQEFATQAKNFLHNTIYLGNKLKVFYSNHSSINVTQSQRCNKVFFEGKKEMYRYKANEQNYKMNPPSQILYISNISPQAYNQQILFPIFQQHGAIESMQFQQKNQKFMCQVKFKDLTDSFTALSYLHGVELFGRKLHISFTRIKF